MSAEAASTSALETKKVKLNSADNEEFTVDYEVVRGCIAEHELAECWELNRIGCILQMCDDTGYAVSAHQEHARRYVACLPLSSERGCSKGVR